ncbi:MAG: DUF1062 domain-containing protein [Bacillota bacterium]|uniref:DUF1062 domain-containing protein n=1 Tax=Virgibacillus sp. AGTR TaxID=2812055 RepID=UPI0003FBD43D|nr:MULTISPECIES: DUF1062 domain-containing protein [Bacillaceae]MCC2250729.1 DUF1062 domain-containing protein [Virgibacillus sp. AGTR]QRZ17221.1 DUF1062 domain-containing protein [Virgibacillus sp. AGTR]
MSFHHLFTYEIIALETPYIKRNCSKCKTNTEFYCSEKFRMNANQKLVDIWLIYNCIHCEGTWNYPILSRVNINKIESTLIQKFMNNDKETIWYYAFQINQLRKLCNDVDTDIRYELRKEKLNPLSSEVTIRICYKYDFGLRIDKLIAEIFAISRSKVNELSQNGTILLNPNIKMKSKVIDELQITVIGDWYKVDALT